MFYVITQQLFIKHSSESNTVLDAKRQCEELTEINKEKMKIPRMPGLWSASLTTFCPRPDKE